MAIFFADANPHDTNAYRSSAASIVIPSNKVILTSPRVVSAQAVPRVTDANASGVISGVMTNADGPLAFARVMLMQDGNSIDDRVLSTTTDAAGNYTFTGLPTGFYIVVPFDPDGAYRSKVVHTLVMGNAPVITGQLLANTGVTAAYSSSLSGVAYKGVWSFGAGYPPGLTINATSGAITGNPSAAGDYVFDVILTDYFGRASASTQSLHVDTDPLYGFVRAYLKLNGANGSNVITDETSNSIWTPSGGVTIQSNELSLDGVDDYVSTPWNDAVWSLGTDAFTFELYVTPSVTPSKDVYMTEGYVGSGNVAFCFQATSGSADVAGARPTFGYYSAGWVACSSPDAMVAATKYHLAAERIKGTPNDTINLYVNGALKASMTVANTFIWPAGDAPIYLGRRWDTSTTPIYARAKLDMFRLTVGANRYGGAFTPPTP